MKELIIVNERDEEIGVKSPKDLTESDIFRVAALWLTNSKGEVLFQKRSMNTNWPGKYQPLAVGGTVEAGETYLSNIIKESKEELGLTLEKEQLSFVCSSLFSGKYGLSFMAGWYHINLDVKIAELVIDENEVESLHWYAKDKAIDLLKNKSELFTYGYEYISEELWNLF